MDGTWLCQCISVILGVNLPFLCAGMSRIYALGGSVGYHVECFDMWTVVMVFSYPGMKAVTTGRYFDTFVHFTRHFSLSTGIET